MDMNVNSAVSSFLTPKSAPVEKTAAPSETAEKAVVSEVKPENVDRVDFSEDAQRYLDEENSKDSDNHVEYYTSYIKPDTDDLSKYTSNELSKLLTDGEITRNEYNEELARRNG